MVYPLPIADAPGPRKLLLYPQPPLQGSERSPHVQRQELEFLLSGKFDFGGLNRKFLDLLRG